MSFKNPISIRTSIKKSELQNILDVILNECNLDAFGYKSSEDEYWGQQINKNKLFFILRLADISHLTFINIYILMDQKEEQQKLYEKINECVNIYQEICEIY